MGLPVNDGSGQAVPDEDIPEDVPTLSQINAMPAQPSEQPDAGQEVPQDDLPQDSGQAVPDEDLPQDAVDQANQDKYGTLPQEIQTGVEGVAQGVAGPAATWAEINLLGENPEDIAGRAAANPWIHGVSEAGGFAGSMLAGTGEAALLGKIGDAAVAASDAGKLGSAAIRGVVEGGLFQGGDEISKGMINPNDPQAPASHILAAALLGGVGGTAIEGVLAPSLAAAGRSGLGQRVSQFLSDMGSRLKFNQTNPDMLGAVTQQLNTLYDSMTGFRDEVYGSGQLKAQNIAELTKDTSPDDVAAHLANIQNIRQSAPTALQNNPAYQAAWEDFEKAVYPSGIPAAAEPMTQPVVREETQDALPYLRRPTLGRTGAGQFKSVFTPETIDGIGPETTVIAGEQPSLFAGNLNPVPQAASPEAVFQATDNLKRTIQRLGRFGQTSTEDLVAQQAQRFSGQLADTLEDQNVWGDAGAFQHDLNQAVSGFIGKNSPSDIFTRRFVEQTGAGQEISPGRVNTYMNQLGKPAAEIKQSVVQNYVDGAEKLQQQLDALHEKFGVQSPTSLSGSVPTDLIKSTYGEMSPGMKAADSLYRLGVPGYASRVAQGVVGSTGGAYEGYRRGGIGGAIAGGIGGAAVGAIAPHLEEVVGTKLRQYAVPALIRVLDSRAPEAAGSALNFAASASRGAARLTNGINSLFQAGGSQAIDAYASEDQKNKLDEQVEKGELNQQITAQAQRDQNAPVQHFAEGGEVKNPMELPPQSQPAKPIFKGMKHFDRAMPEQAMLLASAKTRVGNYLNSLKPRSGGPNLAFAAEAPTAHRSRSYQKALGLAVQPAGILNHMKQGTLTPELMGHFKSMWPEVHDYMSKQLTKKITESQLAGEKPSYRVRQSMSLFLGTPLDGTLTPQAIQSIQAMYAPRPATPPPGVPPKRQTKNTSKLGEISKDHFTQDQAAAQRTASWD